MATTKITITLQDDQLRAIREFVAAGSSPSVSAFIKHAVDVTLFDTAGWRTMLDDAMRQTGGAMTKQERAWADGLLNPPDRQKSPGRSDRPDKNKAA